MPAFAPARPTPVPRSEARSHPPGLGLIGSQPAAALARDLELRRGRSSWSPAPPAALDRTLVEPLPPLSPTPSGGDTEELSWRSDWSRPRTRWWYAPLLLGLAGAAFVVWRELVPPAQPSSAPAAASSAAGETASATPAESAERFAALLAQVHAYRRSGSPQLENLIDREAAPLGRALVEPCEGPTACARAQRARELLEPAPPVAAAAPPAPGPLGSWLSGLTLPGIGITEAAVIQERAEFHTRAAMGREAFQVMLFQCAAYWQPVRDALVQHGLPLDLAAVPMAESGCLVDAEARPGARGLWQLSPAAALAYGLRLEPELIDERVSAVKASRAAAKLLSDLHAKLGSWELALASYATGPFELIARVSSRAPERDLWRLAAEGRVSEATARYVGRVQAFALILANLEHFDFELSRPRPEEDSAELAVPAGTRLGLVARAAGTSITRLRELNPELLADRVPDFNGEPFLLRIPGTARSRARQRLPQLLADADASDRCVPYSFDWGRQRFTKAMASRCEYLSMSQR